MDMRVVLCATFNFLFRTKEFFKQVQIYYNLRNANHEEVEIDIKLFLSFMEFGR